MPDDLPDGLDNHTIDDLVQLRDKASARAQRYGALAAKLDEVIAEHEDYRAQQEAERRRAAFRIISGGALVTLLLWAGRKLAGIGHIHPAAAGALLGTAALAGGAVFAVTQLPTGGPGETGTAPAVTGHPPTRATPTPPTPTAAPTSSTPSPTPTGPGEPETPVSPPPETSTAPPESPPATPAQSAPDTSPPATAEPGAPLDGGPTGEPSEPGGEPPESSEPEPEAGTECVLDADLDPLLRVCVLAR